MALWGKTANTDETKPNWLTPEQKTNCFADRRGWVLRHPNGLEEVLVAMHNAPAALGNATLTEIYFAKGTYSANETNATIIVSFNEKVNVSASPTLPFTVNGAARTATYVTGHGTNKLTFRLSAGLGGAAGNLLAIAATGSITGTITDAVGGAAVDLTWAAGDRVGAAGRRKTYADITLTA
jgi:hypothetical protein